MTISDLDLSFRSCGRLDRRVIVGGLASCGGFQRAHAHQVVRRRGEEKLPVHAGPATMMEFAETADRLHPAEDFFDPFAHALTDVVARVPRRPLVQGATGLFTRDVWGSLQVPQRLDKSARVIAFVAADGHAAT